MGLSFFFNSLDVIPDRANILTSSPEAFLTYLKCLVNQLSLHPAEGSQAHRDALIGGFMFLQIFGGHIGMPLIILTTAFSKKIQKNPIFNNFCVIWFIYATSFTLVVETDLVYGNVEVSGTPDTSSLHLPDAVRV
ncbi:hypothetical protein B0H14DRAFT_2560900 [Mycena olivaceomarginata]|nr:hypothetical protein B0H14DRAFT_2560900 [Mycena olivaceomarginata]